MSQTSKALLTGLLTYFLVHVVYLISGFSPIRNMQNALGWAIDFAAWAVIYIAIYWSLSKLTGKAKQ